jgi:hypothetical protein
MTDARDKAIAAMSKAAWVDQDGLAYRVNAGEMLDAIPADVLADLAIERGALVEVEVMGHNVRVYDMADPDGDIPAQPPTVSLYRRITDGGTDG